MPLRYPVEGGGRGGGVGIFVTLNIFFPLLSFLSLCFSLCTKLCRNFLVFAYPLPLFPSVKNILFFPSECLQSFLQPTPLALTAHTNCGNIAIIQVFDLLNRGKSANTYPDIGENRPTVLHKLKIHKLSGKIVLNPSCFTHMK